MQPLCALAFIYDGIFKGLGWMKELRDVLLFSTFIVFIPTLLIANSYGYKLEGIFFAFTLVYPKSYLYSSCCDFKFFNKIQIGLIGDT